MRYNEIKLVESTLFKKQSDMKYFDTVNKRLGDYYGLFLWKHLKSFILIY
jgi:hypothetical protein